jgi:hypothetical protein
MLSDAGIEGDITQGNGDKCACINSLIYTKMVVTLNHGNTPPRIILESNPRKNLIQLLF